MHDTPSQTPSSNHGALPGNAGAPPLQFDEAGHPYFQDATGHFVSYFGPPPPPLLYPPGLPIPHNYASVLPSHNAMASSSRPAPVIDPALSSLPPLPDSSDDNLSDGPTIAKAQGYGSSSKVAGSHHKDKGKQRAEPAVSKGKQQATAPDISRKRKVVSHTSDEDEDEPDTKRSRPHGAGNYHTEDVTTLLDAVESELPLGQRGWAAIHRRYSKWAQKNKRPDRTVKSLETKYKQLTKTTMPTGDGYCPPDVKRAHGIEELINEHACTHDLDDNDFNGNVKHEHTQVPELVNSNEEDTDDIEIIETPAPKTVRSALVRCPDPLTSHRKARVSSINLVAKLTDTFDPAAVKNRDDQHVECSFNNTQLLTMTQQLRDYQNINDTLRGEISTLHDRLHDAE
ncbi:hypothetical protein DXG01_010299 [Tephrocybe rancida]|nr:hypothetical protein DXG01_010299 [Tephrocybe rancida]